MISDGKDEKDMTNTELSQWPCFEEDEISAVARVLESGRVNYWTGEECKLFEEEFATYTGCKYAVAVANGSIALELALRALNIGMGDEVIVPSRTFIATASAVVLSGATPIFADVNMESQNITPDTIEPVLSSATKAVIVVHLAGWPCDMDPIKKLARERGLNVIEDCAQAHGAAYKGRKVGSLGDIAAFSFCQDKIMTTGGEGGMVTTNDRGLWETVWSYKDHGKNYVLAHSPKPRHQFQWLHDTIGTNLRMTEIQAAIGRVQLGKLDKWVEKRRSNASILTQSFSEIPALRATIPSDVFRHSYYKYYVFLRRGKKRWNRDRIISTLNDGGIFCQSGSCSETYLEKAFSDLRKPRQRLPVARELGETSLMFLVHPTIGEEGMIMVSDKVAQVMEKNSM